jgi:hypothetical protein
MPDKERIRYGCANDGFRHIATVHGKVNPFVPKGSRLIRYSNCFVQVQRS